jgi:hypothetical protein
MSVVVVDYYIFEMNDIHTGIPRHDISKKAMTESRVITFLSIRMSDEVLNIFDQQLTSVIA